MFKLTQLLIIATCLSAFAYGKQNYRSETPLVPVGNKNSLADFFQGTFPTRLDHFKTTNQETILFNYIVNGEFHLENGPLYIYIKNVDDRDNRWLEEGLMVDIARELNGALYTFDQRYFGQNIPTETASYTDLQFLTIEQTLADIASFIRFIKQDNYQSRVILWGSGFGGTLAAWARKKYPHLVGGAWSSSGFFDFAIQSYTQYDLLQYTILDNGGDECRNIVRSAFYDIHDFILAGNSSEISATFNLCNPIDESNENDVFAFYENFYQILIDQFNQFHSMGVVSFCRDLTTVTGLTPIEAFARWFNHVIFPTECFDHSYSSIIERGSSEDWAVLGTTTNRQWAYAQCTQIGTFLVADNFTWLPIVPIEYYYAKCHDLFGDDYISEILPNTISLITSTYGSINPRSSNVIYTNGDIDPWLYLGVVSVRDVDSFAINIAHVGKSADLSSISPLDTIGLVQAKNEIIDIIKIYSDLYNIN